MTLYGARHSLPPAFRAVAGGVTGGDHRRAMRDGQDGHAVIACSRLTAAVVTDGCSSGRSSEVGARLGARWLASLIARRFGRHEPLEAARLVTSDLVSRLEALALSLGETIEAAIVGDMLLFGFLAAVVTDAHAVVFGVGDGVAYVDGRTTVIDPGADNAPTYPAYALLGATIAPSVLHVGPADAVSVLAVATDGAADLLGPRFEALVGDERLFQNPSLLRKRLTVLSERGGLFDDTTIGIVRRAS